MITFSYSSVTTLASNSTTEAEFFFGFVTSHAVIQFSTNQKPMNFFFHFYQYFALFLYVNFLSYCLIPNWNCFFFHLPVNFLGSRFSHTMVRNNLSHRTTFTIQKLLYTMHRSGLHHIILHKLFTILLVCLVILPSSLNWALRIWTEQMQYTNAHKYASNKWNATVIENKVTWENCTTENFDNFLFA